MMKQVIWNGESWKRGLEGRKFAEMQGKEGGKKKLCNFLLFFFSRHCLHLTFFISFAIYICKKNPIWIINKSNERDLHVSLSHSVPVFLELIWSVTSVAFIFFSKGKKFYFVSGLFKKWLKQTHLLFDKRTFYIHLQIMDFDLKRL